MLDTLNLMHAAQPMVGGFAALIGSYPPAISILSLVYVTGLSFILIAPETGRRPLAA